jgi:hypothetical protein
MPRLPVPSGLPARRLRRERGAAALAGGTTPCGRSMSYGSGHAPAARLREPFPDGMRAHMRCDGAEGRRFTSVNRPDSAHRLSDRFAVLSLPDGLTGGSRMQCTPVSGNARTAWVPGFAGAAEAVAAGQLGADRSGDHPDRPAAAPRRAAGAVVRDHNRDSPASRAASGEMECGYAPMRPGSHSPPAAAEGQNLILGRTLRLRATMTGSARDASCIFFRVLPSCPSIDAAGRGRLRAL